MPAMVLGSGTRPKGWSGTEQVSSSNSQVKGEYTGAVVSGSVAVAGVGAAANTGLEAARSGIGFAKFEKNSSGYEEAVSGPRRGDPAGRRMEQLCVETRTEEPVERSPVASAGLRL